MHAARRLVHEISGLRGTLSTKELARYVFCVVRRLPTVAHDRTLAPADSLMLHDVDVHMNGATVTVPVGDITELLAGHDSTPTFGGIREMYASDVYLRAFAKGIPMRRVVDLGANRGMFSTMATKVYGTEIAVGVEPSPYFTPVLERLTTVNGLDPERLPRVEARIGSGRATGVTTMDEITDRFGLDEIDFLKCDIEGGEYDVFTDNNDFLGSVRNIAMEVHPAEGSTDTLVRALSDGGFTVRTTDQFGTDTAPANAAYLYASSADELAATS